MAQTTIAPDGTQQTRQRGPAKTYWADVQEYQELEASDKNARLTFVVHPKLDAQIRRAIVNLARQEGQNPNDYLQTLDQRLSVKRSALHRWLQQAIANAAGYLVTADTPLVIPSARGGGYSKTAIFTTLAAEIFASVRAVGEMVSMSDDQMRQIAFERVHTAMASHEMLSGANVPDETLQALWSDSSVELELDDDDDDE